MVSRVVSNGDVEVPTIGLGTWRLTGNRCRRAVETALDLGYRHVDTAQRYGNERAVGLALAASDVPREEVFLTTKVFGTNAGYDDVLDSTEESLDRLGVDRVDLLLLHWPNPLVDVEETMAAMNRLREEGKARHLGVSNFSRRQFAAARAASDAPLVTNQVQFHPYNPQRELLRYCQDEGVLLTAYSPLAHGGVIHDDTLTEIGARYGKTPAQVALRWAIQHRNVLAIPKASSRAHVAENLDVFDFELSRAEMETVTNASPFRTGLAWVRGRLGV
ncbi:aldo/keto reductase [Salinilacihabitans rarus]|uniref:aldo/keto reductase n=1 Tax=Salinilacihabitans rarus TaxID=2961596 RepID=UPI0020C92810|nr:aldo/keto reductase [Salinilacihabitans rarus]